jgi:hypothetical protein
MKPVIFQIKKLGAVRDSRIELRPFMVFSGESGLGKSYVAFLVHYLYTLLTSYRLNSFFIENNIDFKKIFDRKQSGQVLLSIPAKDIFSWINKDAIDYIGYLIGHEGFEGEVEINFPYEDLSFDFVYEDELGGLDNHEELFYKIELGHFSYKVVSRSFQATPEPFTVLLNAVLIDEIWGDHRILKNCFLLPPSRGALMELTERPAFRSGMYEEFFNLKVALGRPLEKSVEQGPTITECLSEVNNGNLQQVDGKIMYFTKDGADMPLTAAASSIKELAPFTMMLNKFSPEGISILFEEPEAHLHPERQIKVADLIACSVNKGCQMQVTTHSDFFIKRINNLMKLYILKDKMSHDVYMDLLKDLDIKEDCLINPKSVGAFLLKRNDKGYSEVITQNIFADNEIPFESFYKVIDEDIQLSGMIKKMFDKECI